MRSRPYFPSLLAATVLAVAAAAPAHAHDWYPIDCCSGFDCKPVDVDLDISPDDGGWRVHATGELIPHGDGRIRQTPQEARADFHRCSVAGRPEGRTLCLFIPQYGS
jgi:hypothetical protein